MTPDERLEWMVRDCVDHEVLEVTLPAGIAERAVARTRRRRVRRFGWSAGLASLATAAAVVAGANVLHPSADLRPPADATEAADSPRELDGRVRVAEFPRAAHEGWVESDSRQDRRVWTVVLRLDGQRRSVRVSVFSGAVTLEGIMDEYRDAVRATGWKRVPDVHEGEAVTWTVGDRRHVVLQREPRLVVHVVTEGAGPAWPVRIAEGVSVG